MFSCVTTKSLNYMQKPSDGIPNYVDTVGFSEYAVQKGDYLNIRVYSLNKEDIALYNCNENTSDYKMKLHHDFVCMLSMNRAIYIIRI